MSVVVRTGRRYDGGVTERVHAGPWADWCARERRDGPATCPPGGAALACLVAGAVPTGDQRHPGVSRARSVRGRAGPAASAPGRTCARRPPRSAAGGVVVPRGSRSGRTHTTARCAGGCPGAPDSRHHPDPHRTEPTRRAACATGHRPPSAGAPSRRNNLRMTQVWPGSAYPLGATYDGTGTNFAIFSEVAEKVELCLFDDEGNEERIRLPEMDGYVWHAFLPGIHPGQRYGFRVHGPYDPAQGLRCNPNKLLLDPYAKAIDGQIDWDQSVFGYDFKTKERNDDDSAPHMPKSVVINPYFDWGVDRPPKTPYHKTVIYEAHVKGLTMTNPRIPEELRGTYAGVAHPATIEYLHRPRHHRDRAHAGAPVRAGRHPPAEGPAQLLGLQHDRLLRAAQRVRQRHHGRAARAGVQGHGPRPARGGHRGHPRRRLQPHRRGQPPRPHAVVQGHRQPDVLPAGRGRQAVLHGLHRHREHAQRPDAAVAAADHGLAALLGHRDARRRLPLRPRLHPRPRAARRRPAGGLLRPGAPGPDRQPGEADRRAVGRRRGRLPGRQLPRPVDRVERQVPRHRPRLLARRGRHRRRVRQPDHRLVRPLPALGTSSVRQHQLRHRARRLHAQRPRLLQREAQRGQRRGQQRRREPQPQLELRRRGPDRRPGDPAPAGASSGATSSPR